MRTRGTSRARSATGRASRGACVRALVRFGLLLVLACGAVSLGPGSARADTVEQLFAAANRAYFAGDLPAAVRGYERLLELGIEDPDVSYNLATAHARRGAYGQAIRYYERTLRLSPGHPDALHNVRIVRDELGRRQLQRRGQASVEARPPLVESLVQGVSVTALAVAFVALESLFFLLLLARRNTRAETPRLALAVAAPIVLLLTLASGAGLVVKDRATSRAEAIVVTDQTELREGPDARAASRGAVLEGARVTVLGDEGTFARVRAEDGREGWVNRGDVGEI